MGKNLPVADARVKDTRYGAKRRFHVWDIIRADKREAKEHPVRYCPKYRAMYQKT